MINYEDKKINFILNINDVHIWKVKIPYHLFNECNFNMDHSKYHLLNKSNLMSSFKKVLDEVDFKSAMRFYRESDQIRALVSKFTLKKLISKYLNLNSNQIHFFYNEFSKPFICHAINPNSLQFNLSHAGEWIAFAFTCHAQIGVDIEKYDPFLDRHSLKDHVFSRQELTEWLILPEQDKLAAFYHVWSCKEAILKGIGTGLSYAPNQISVTTNPQMQPTILNLQNCEYEQDPNAWSLSTFPVQSNYSSIFAVRKKNFKATFYEWDWDSF